MEEINLNLATFVGIDAHRQEHTALAINRLEEEKGRLAFENTKDGIREFLRWLGKLEPETNRILIGIEGGGNTRNALVGCLAENYQNLFEINPLYTKQRRDYGTSGNKSDLVDAQLAAEVLIRKWPELPRITQADLSPQMLCLRKTVGFYEEQAVLGAKIKNQLKGLFKEKELVKTREEKEILVFLIQQKKKDLKKINNLKRKLEIGFNHFLPDKGRNLTSLRGISLVLAAKLIAHTKRGERFSSLDKFIKYAGIAPLEKSSGGAKRHIKNKRGNRKLNSTLYLVALNQLRWNPKAKQYFQKKLKEGKTRKQALRCLIKRVACIVYGMLKSGENYRKN